MAFSDAQNFRKAVNEDPALAEEFNKLRQSSDPLQVADAVAFARQHGFQVTEADLAEVWEHMQVEGELSDLELELVSGGGQSGCNVPAATAPPRNK